IGGERLRRRFAKYQKRPEAFAKEVLGSRWWSRQREVAEAVAGHRRVVVRSANGVGKTYLAADLALWFLYCFQPSIVVTTAPTKRQVENLLWEEIRRRQRDAKPKLPGNVQRCRIKMSEKWFAMGQSAAKPDSFQGYHSPNLLVVFDEASGIED